MEVRTATRQKLGAIVVGEGFKITNEGVLSIDEPIEQEEYVEFTRERLREIYRQSKNGGGE